jgi:hypothetical protein
MQYDLMSIPDFQRGLVWERSTVALLLESLYYNTPCGSIVLWTPAAHSSGGGKDAPAKYTIVDGQQRIRSLYRVFGEASTENEAALPDLATVPQNTEDDGSDQQSTGDSRGTWCLNLGAMPEFQDSFRGGKRFALFRCVRDPRGHFSTKTEQRILSGAPVQDREALLPLQWFLDHDDAQIRALVRSGANATIAKAALAVLGTGTVKQRLREMRTNHVFQVSILDAGRSLRDVIGIYNRINTAGKRVESEERAFANLVGEFEGIDGALADFFAKVHGPVLSRDDLLQRHKENRFGFKLFMRAFVMALAYHTDRTIGTSAFSFEAVNPEALTKARSALPAIAAATVKVLADVATIVRVALHCDDLRMLPETASLWPLIQLLARFPTLTQHAENELCAIALRLVLADLNKADLLPLCEKINRVANASEALTLFDEHELLAAAAIAKEVRERIDKTQSLTARYALILYWLLRRAGAKDFQYAKNPVQDIGQLRKIHPLEAMLCEDVSPEKQHIVPHRRLKELFGLDGQARLGRHEAHDIGNLTYISMALNSFTVGVGARSLRVDQEPEKNRGAHLLNGGPELLKAFSSACSEADLKNARASYRSFCAIRRRLMSEGIICWEQELRERCRHADLSTVPSVRRLVSPTPTEMIQSFGYPAAVTTSLVKLRNRESTKTGRYKDGYLTFNCVLRKRGRSRQVLRVDVSETASDIVVRLRGKSWPALPALLSRWVRKTKVDAVGCTLPPDAPEAGMALDWLNTELSRMADVGGESESTTAAPKTKR